MKTLLITLILSLLTFAQTGWAAPTKLRKGIFAGSWRSQPVQFHITRQKGKRFDGSLLFMKGPQKGQRSELTLTQSPQGQVAFTRYMKGSRTQKSHAAHLYFKKSTKGHLAVFVGRLGSGVHDLVKLFIPTRWRFSYQCKIGMYTGHWHHYPAVFALTKKDPKRPVFSGHMVYTGGRFEGQITPIQVKLLAHGRLLITRDVGNGNVQQVKTGPPVLYRTGTHGVVKLEGPMTGHWGSGMGRIFLSWRAPTTK